MDILKIRSYSSGQAILIVLLVSALIMTLGLSTAKRTVVDTKIDTDEELLKQAFNTAESGVDYYLSTGTTNYEAPDKKSTAAISIQKLGLGKTMLSGEPVQSENAFLFWLAEHNTDGSLNLSTNYYKGNTVDICVDDSFDKSLKIDYFYVASNNYGVIRRGVNFNGSSPADYNFETLGTINKCVSINLQQVANSKPIMIAITPIGKITSLKFVGDLVNDFPVQGEEIVSVGRAGNVSASTGVNTQLKVINRYKIPAFMLDAITAGNSVLSK